MPFANPIGGYYDSIYKPAIEKAKLKADRADADPADADQVVWRGVCEALGFRCNTRPFGQLAEAVPWSYAAQVVADRGPVGWSGWYGREASPGNT